MTHKPLQAYIEHTGILFAISAKLFTIHIPLQIQSWSQIAAHKQHIKDLMYEDMFWIPPL